MNANECPFCKQPPQHVDDAAHHDFFLLFTCKACLPEHDTTYRVLYNKKDLELLSISVRLDEYYIIYRFADNSTLKPNPHTTIFKNAAKKLLENLSARINPVFDLDYILELPFNDIEAAKRKLNIYTTFS